jgi:hypothetical protein
MVKPAPRKKVLSKAWAQMAATLTAINGLGLSSLKWRNNETPARDTDSNMSKHPKSTKVIKLGEAIKSGR